MRREFDYFRRRVAAEPRAPLVAAPAFAAAMGMVWLLGSPAAAQEENAAPNVSVDYSVLDRLGGGSGGDAPLPAPSEMPISRIVAPGSSGLSAPTSPEVIPQGTALAAPTTPIEATTLDGTALNGAETSADLPGGLTVGGVVGDILPPAPRPPAAAEATAARPASIEPSAGADAIAEDGGASTLIDGQLRIPYEAGARALSDADRRKVDALIERLHADPGLRLQVLAYAAGDEDEVTRARGLSLARALALRRYLREQGIAMSRMDVRALGNSAQEEPADRVDLIPVRQ